MQLADYWQQFEHTGRVEDYLRYLQNAEREDTLVQADASDSRGCRAEGCTDLTAGEGESCRNPCM